MGRVSEGVESLTPSRALRQAKILILDRFYFPDEQATSVYLTEATEALQDRFEFEILCGPPAVVTEPPSASFPKVQVHSIPALRLPKRFLLGRALNDFGFLVAAFVWGLFVPRPDLLVTQTSPPGIWWVGFLLSRWHRTPWVHISKDVFPENLKMLNGELGRGKVLEVLNRANTILLKQAERILVIGEDMRKKFLEKGFIPERLVKTSDWADLDFIRVLPKENAFREKHGFKNKFVVLYAGNFGRIYNFEDLFGAAERLKANPEIIFLLVGEGALKEKILRERERRELSNVLVVPFEPRFQLPEVFASADASVVLLRKGMAGLSVPSKIYSILASGRPILACVEEESEIARLVGESHSGFVLSPGNAEGLAKRISELFENRRLGDELGTNARRFAEAQDFKTRALQDYERTFLEVLNGHSH